MRWKPSYTRCRRVASRRVARVATSSPPPRTPQPRGYHPPRTLDDVALHPGERGLLLGMTRTGKTTLAEWLLATAQRQYPKQKIVVLDSKPHFRGWRELNGMPASVRYRKWDTGYGSFLPGSVVLPPGRDAKADIRWAWNQGYQTILAQIPPSRHELPWLASVIEAAYEAKRKDEQLLIYVDETNHFFRWRRSLGNAIINTLTSGGERNVGCLLGGQRPVNIGVEAMESATHLYWFYTPYREDVKKLRAMDVPLDAQPPVAGTHGFYFHSRTRQVRGVCKLPAAAVEQLRQRG